MLKGIILFGLYATVLSVSIAFLIGFLAQSPPGLKTFLDSPLLITDILHVLLGVLIGYSGYELILRKS